MKPRYLSFTLSMPGNNSWNGKWSGEGNLYVIIKKFSTIKAKEKLELLLKNPSHYYNFGDGWCANVKIKEVSGYESRNLKKKSRGFCGYDWMVDSILDCGEIKA